MSEILSRNGTWKTYVPADGLAGYQIEDICEDAEGYLWFGSVSGGASRFDGDTFQTFTTRDGLCSNYVSMIHQDQAGRLWFATNKGICYFDGMAFHAVDGPKAAVTFIFEDRDQRLWLGAVDGIFCGEGGAAFKPLQTTYSTVDGRSFELPYGEFRGIAQDALGRIWFRGGHGLACWDGEHFVRCEVPQAEYYLVGQAGPGELWLVCDGEIWRGDGSSFAPAGFSAPSSFRNAEVSTQVRKICRDHQGRSWFCTTGGGVLCWDGEAAHTFTTEDGLALDYVCGAAQDREGHLWFATWGGGISRFDPEHIECIGREQGLENHWVGVEAEDHRGGLWMRFTVIDRRPDDIAYYDGKRVDFREGLGLRYIVAMPRGDSGWGPRRGWPIIRMKN